jgi:hypothetical protein
MLVVHDSAPKALLMLKQRDELAKRLAGALENASALGETVQRLECRHLANPINFESTSCIDGADKNITENDAPGTKGGRAFRAAGARALFFTPDNETSGIDGGSSSTPDTLREKNIHRDMTSTGVVSISVAAEPAFVVTTPASAIPVESGSEPWYLIAQVLPKL